MFRKQPFEINQNDFNQSNLTSTAKHKEKKMSKEKPYLKDFRDQQIQELKVQNLKLKKSIKQSQAKRSQITKQCAHVSKKLEEMENLNYKLSQQLKQNSQHHESQKYRIQELKFLNKQLTNQLDQSRHENEELVQKLRYSNQILEKKYEELEQKTYKRMEKSMKRIKKGIHFMQSLSAKDIEKTKELLIQNLSKALEALRGKYSEQDYEIQIDELMNPLKKIQEQLHQRNKDYHRIKQQKQRLEQQVKKCKKMERQIFPQYKQSIEKMKKSLGQLRSQLAENQYDKNQMKKKYQEKLKEMQQKYGQLFREFRKLQLQKKMYENKLEELENDVLEEKQQRIGENEMWKKLYNNQSQFEQDDSCSQKLSETPQYRYSSKDKNSEKNRGFMKKNFSSNELKKSMKNSHSSLYGSRKKLQLSSAQEQSMTSQQSLKNEIYKIDQEIVGIQETLAKQLEMYR